MVWKQVAVQEDMVPVKSGSYDNLEFLQKSENLGQLFPRVTQ